MIQMKVLHGRLRDKLTGIWRLYNLVSLADALNAFRENLPGRSLPYIVSVTFLNVLLSAQGMVEKLLSLMPTPVILLILLHSLSLAGRR